MLSTVTMVFGAAINTGGHRCRQRRRQHHRRRQRITASATAMMAFCPAVPIFSSLKNRFVPSVDKLTRPWLWRWPRTSWWSLLLLSPFTYMVGGFFFFRPRIYFDLPRLCLLMGGGTVNFLLSRNLETIFLIALACACFAVHTFGIRVMVKMKVCFFCCCFLSFLTLSLYLFLFCVRVILFLLAHMMDIF